MAGKRKPLPVAEIRKRQRAAGKASAGPRREPSKGDRVTPEGYVQPGKYKGSRHVERNREIVRARVEGATVKALARKYRLAPKTIEHIVRYFVDEEA